MHNEVYRWRDLLKKRGTSMFVGRDRIVDRFRLNCIDAVPKDLVTVLHGAPGFGKTATMKRLREIASEYGVFSTYVDGGVATRTSEEVILRVMVRIAGQFSAHGIPLTQFDERYREYIAAVQKIEEDTEAPGHPFDAIGGLQDRDVWHQQVWDNYLKTVFPANVVTLVRYPIAQLTPIFVHDLNTWSLVRRILLCFDDWHLVEEQVGAWLQQILFTGEFSTKIWILLASQDPLTLEWSRLSPVMIQHELKELSESEVRTLLDKQDNLNRDRIADIVVFSRGVPVWVQVLASAHEGIAGDLALSPLDRYIKWLSSEQRHAVLIAAVANYVDESVLDSILDDEAGAWFEWLRKSGILTARGDAWACHPALRDPLLSWARRENIQTVYDTHHKLRTYFLNLEKGEILPHIPGESGDPLLLGAAYHGFMTGEAGMLRESVKAFFRLLREDIVTAGRYIDTWSQAAATQENANMVVEWAFTLTQMWDALYANDFNTAATICEDILRREAVDEEIKTVVQQFYAAVQARFPQPSLEFSAEDAVALEVAAEVVTEVEIEPDTRTVTQEASLPVQTGEAFPQTVGSVNQGSQSDEHSVKTVPDEGLSLLETDAKVTADESGSPSPHKDLSAQVEESAIQQTDIQEDIPDYQTADEWVKYGDVKLAARNYDTALDAYRKASSLDPAHIKAYFGQAQVYTQLQDFSSALEMYDFILEADPDFVPVLKNRGWLYSRQQQYWQALEDYNRALERSPDDLSLLFNRGTVYYRLKDYANAIKDYDEVIRQDPAYVEAYVNRGITQSVVLEYRRAIADFNQAITLDPDNGHAYHRRGRAYVKLQQLPLAHNDFVKALEKLPNDVGIVIDLGLLYVKQGDYQKALLQYQRAIEREPDHALAHYNAACAAALSGNVERACQSLMRAIELHPPYRDMAAQDADFSAIQQTSAFQRCIQPA